MSGQPAYTAYHPRWIRTRASTYWWLRRGSYLAFILRELSSIFLVVFGMVVAAWLASALAWSGVGLIAFVPLVGLAVFPLQIAALLLRGLVFEYIGLTAMGAYVTLYRRFAAAEAARTTQTASLDNRSLRPAH